MIPRWAWTPALVFGATTFLSAQPFQAERLTVEGVAVVRLRDAARGATVSIAPKIGNIAQEYSVNGRNALWFPAESIGAFAKNPRLGGNPLLWPWANRIDGDVYFVNGRRYSLNAELGNFRRDGSGLPIHGLVAFSPDWEVVELAADDRAAWVVSRLDFYRHPALAAQFPFAHRVEMTYRLSGEGLEVKTRIENLSTEPLPISLGFHPYFQVHDAPRERWRVRLPARTLWTLDDKLTPTGATEPASAPLPEGPEFTLGERRLDHVFGDLIREGDGSARFEVRGDKQRVEALFGAEFPIAVVYAPDRPFICFEPMTAPTNAFNLAHRGLYDRLPSVAPGATWEGSYVIRASGF